MARCGINIMSYKLNFHVSILILILCCLLFVANGKKHILSLDEDDRKQITVSTFGFLKGGILSVNITNFHYKIISKSSVPIQQNVTLFGFTLDKSGNSGLSSYLENEQEKCILQDGVDKNDKKDSVSIVLFKMDLTNKRMVIEPIGQDVANLTISMLDFDSFQSIHAAKRRSSGLRPKNGYMLKLQTRELHTDQDDNSKINKTIDNSKSSPTPGEPQQTPPQTSSPRQDQDQSTAHLSKLKEFEIKEVNGYYNTHFLVYINNSNEEGLYNLFFHNCLQYRPYVSQIETSWVSMLMNITEVNNGNYLSAGNQPEPTLFFIFSLLYLICGGVWLMVLRRSEKTDVFKIHYLMLAVVWVKSLSCLFHGINSHFIEKSGIPEEAWAILWYIVYLMRGALMFGTILLIGAGWAFIKHMLSKKEKKLFAIFLPLQILDQVAWVIVEESDEGLSRHTTWKQIFFVVDLLCCGAILFPVVWSIRHLQEASRVDGKAAMNLNKLKLFRHFYILVVCYIYFTRMIVYLLEITLPFRHEWLKEFSKEVAVFLFFLVTGYKFQPATDNPYLQVPADSEDEIEMDEVLTKTGSMDGLSKVNQHLAENKPDNDNGIKQRESSLEYD